LNIVIVGHGPSLVGAGRGKEIDSFQKVVRMKHGTFGKPEDYGIKIDLMVASTEVPGCFRPDCENIAYPKKGWYYEKPIQDLGFPITVALNLSNMWNAWFRDLGAKHPNISTGTAAIIFACHRYRPDEVYLAGYDTLVDPSKEFDRNGDIPRTGGGAYPDHDWETEHRLLAHIEQAYSVSIEPLEI